MYMPEKCNEKVFRSNQFEARAETLFEAWRISSWRMFLEMQTTDYHVGRTETR
jgi:hypothetical protein